jgi:hypothetical protein
VNGDEAAIICNECGFVIRTAPVEQGQAALEQMASDEIGGEQLRH